MRLLNIHRRDPRNVGDLQASPFKYFTFDAEHDSIDILDIAKLSQPPDVDAIVVGGGGLLGYTEFDVILTKLRRDFRGRIVVWGAGLNKHFFAGRVHLTSPIRLFGHSLLNRALLRPYEVLDRSTVLARRSTAASVTWLKTSDRVGIRDYDAGFDWVPCVSCMDSKIDQYRSSPPKYPLVAIEHPHYCKLDLDNIPRLSNIDSSFEEVLAFAASGETVLCSSYHAAYWSLLLGRRVIVVPWSDKFFGLRYPLQYCFRPSELRECLAQAQAYPDALAECRQRNLQFAQDLSELLGIGFRVTAESSVETTSSS